MKTTEQQIAELYNEIMDCQDAGKVLATLAKIRELKAKL